MCLTLSDVGQLPLILGQCVMPALEGLFPMPWDAHIQSLLFTLCFWHGMAKLRMHTDETLHCLERLTITLGKSLRHFTQNVCPQFNTVDTLAASRGRAAVRREAHKHKRSDAALESAHQRPGNARPT